MEQILIGTPFEMGAAILRDTIQGQVILPGDLAYEEARHGWNLFVDQYPALIVVAKTAADIVTAVNFARQHNLTIAVQGTGHANFGFADDALLIATREMAEVDIDPVSQTAYVEAGAKWGAVLAAAQMHGLAPLLGSSVTVGAVGYTLGGGYGWLGRKYGFSTDHVIRFEVVTADSQQRIASAVENSDLFWGLRGGGGSLGIVTSMMIRLFPVTQVYAGNLFYPVTMARDLFKHYRAWIAQAPNELTTSVLIMNFPPLPELPDFLRGQSFAIVRGCYCGPIAAGERLLRHWRQWRTPIIDDFKEMPFSEAASISNDPVDPLPAYNSGGWIRELSDEVIDALERFATGKDDPTPVIFAEVRHAGGAVARQDIESAAIGNRDGNLILSVVGLAPTVDVYKQLSAKTANLMATLKPWMTGGVYMNFLEGDEARARIGDGLAPGAYERLTHLKARYDPHNMLRHGFNIPPSAQKTGYGS